MQSRQLQQAVRERRCKSFAEVNAYCKEYWLQLHKQYGMHLLKQAKPFIDIKKFLEVGLMNADQLVVIEKLIMNMQLVISILEMHLLMNKA